MDSLGPSVADLVLCAKLGHLVGASHLRALHQGQAEIRKEADLRADSVLGRVFSNGCMLFTSLTLAP